MLPFCVEIYKRLPMYTKRNYYANFKQNLFRECALKLKRITDLFYEANRLGLFLA